MLRGSLCIQMRVSFYSCVCWEISRNFSLVVGVVSQLRNHQAGTDGKRVRSTQHTAAIQVRPGGGWRVPLRSFGSR
jgi:hypothetical protein